MGIQKVEFQSQAVLPVGACDCVLLCLTAEAASTKVTASPGLVIAQVGDSIRNLGKGRFAERLRGGNAFNVRNAKVVQYLLEIDDSQLNVDPSTGQPYIIECSDIVELNPYCCTTMSVLSGDQVKEEAQA